MDPSREKAGRNRGGGWVGLQKPWKFTDRESGEVGFCGFFNLYLK